MNKRQKQVVAHQIRQENAVLRELEEQYEETLKAIDQQILEYQSMDDTPSKAYRIEYQKRMKQQLEANLELLHSKQYQTVDQYLNDTYTNGFVGTMYDLHGQNIPVIAPIDQKAVLRAVTLDTKLKEPLYKAIGVDVQKLKKSISSEITRGLASGMLYEDIARNVKSKTKAPLGRIKTIVRTEGHRIQEASTEDARQVAKSKGADVVKQWDATLDGKTRETHRMLDGQIRETDEPFEYGTKKAMYPGDFGLAEEDCNCRCLALTRARSALDEEEYKAMQERARYFGLLSDDSKAFGHEKGKTTFADFKKKYLKAAQNLEKSGKSGIMEPGNNPFGFSVIQQSHTIDDDIGSFGNPVCNPKYSTKQWGYIQNCQRCVQAYEFRRRGYDVVATERPKANNTIFWGSECFTDANGNNVNFVFNQTEQQLQSVLANAPDGARFSVYIKWKGSGNAAHVFVAEKKSGVVRFVDPQSGNTDVSIYLKHGEDGKYGYFRMDDKQITTSADIVSATMEAKTK